MTHKNIGVSMKMQLPEDRKEEGTALQTRRGGGGGGTGRRSPTCVEIASPLRNAELFALEPAGWLFAVGCWFYAEQKVVCVLVASGQEKKEREGKKKKEELIFSEASAVEMSLEEKRAISLLLVGEGAGRGG